MHAGSKRLRLRFFPTDAAAVETVLSSTKHSSRSNVIRAALALYQQAWSSRVMGFRVVFYRGGSSEMPDALELTQKRADSESGKRVHTEQSIEIRVTPTDYERIESILSMEAADTVSEAVRRGVRLYAAAIEKRRDGWELVAVSPSGDLLPLLVGGAGPAPASGATPAKPELRGGLVFHLPRSLDGLIQELVEREGCSADALITDLVRTEAQARLDRLVRGAAAPAEPAATVGLATPETFPYKEFHDLLKGTASLAEELHLLIGTPPREHGQQGQLTDLLFGADSGFELAVVSAAPVDLEDSPDGLKQHIEFINSRLNQLLMLVQMQERPKSRSRTVSKHPSEKHEPHNVQHPPQEPL